MSRDEIMEELLAAEEAGDVDAAEVWQAMLDEMDHL